MQKNVSPSGYLPSFQHFATQAIHVGQEPEQWNSRALVIPISLATTFKQDTPGQSSGFVYGRSGNPTRNCLEKAVAALDGAKHSLAFASGLAATTTITHLLKAGDEVICMDEVYGGTNRYFRRVASEFGLKVSFVECSNTKLLEAAITPRTKLVWIETPTNPSLKLTDIEACAHIVHKHGDIILVVDNTFMSPYFQRPLALGADICMCSATKYMNGHSDVIMGLVSVNSDDLNNRLRFLQNSIGAVPSPFDCYLCCRGLKTLQVRMEKHFKSGMAVARFLESNPRVEKVIYPGLASHPQHELAKRQCTGCPGMVSFYIKGALRHAEAFLKNLKVFTLAESLGGYESLAELPPGRETLSQKSCRDPMDNRKYVPYPWFSEESLTILVYFFMSVVRIFRESSPVKPDPYQPGTNPQPLISCGNKSITSSPKAIMTHASVPEKDRATLGISDTLIRLSVGLEDEKDLLEDLDQALKAAHP